MIEDGSIKTNWDLDEQISLIESLSTDPLAFIEMFLERELSPKQRLFIEMTKIKKHVVAIWSRQSGKSTVIASYILWRLLYGTGAVVNGESMVEKIAVCAPIKDQLVNLYDKIRTLIDKNDHVSSFIEKINSNRIIAKNGNMIQFMSASPGSHIRGFTATCIVIDETQDITDHKYQADIMPFGATTNALVIEAGTPKTKNHFYQTINSPDVEVIYQPWFECPFLSEEYVMRQKSMSLDTLWRQEYLCEFVEEGVLVFPSKYFEEEINTKTKQRTGRCNVADYSWIKNEDQLNNALFDAIAELRKAGALYSMGLDLGRTKDQTVITVVRIDKRPIRIELQIAFDVGTPYTYIAKVLKRVYAIYEPNEFNLDYTNEKGFPDILIENDVPIIVAKDNVRGTITFQSKVKTEMVTNAQILLEKFQFQLPTKNEVCIQQFMNQQFEISDVGKYTYYHPSNENDDRLWSTLLALKNVHYIDTGSEVKFLNPWDKHNEAVYGANKSTKEELRAVNSIKMSRKNRHLSPYARNRYADQAVSM